MFGLMPFRRERRAERTLAGREYAPLDLFCREFASLFDRAFGAWPLPFELPWEMTAAHGLDVQEKDGAAVVRVELPGFEASELDLHVTGELLTVRAEHKEGPPKEGEKPAEHRYGRVERTVMLPAGVVPDKAEAVYRNGVLEVRMPLAPESRPQRIEVRT